MQEEEASDKVNPQLITPGVRRERGVLRVCGLGKEALVHRGK